MARGPGGHLRYVPREHGGVDLYVNSGGVSVVGWGASSRFVESFCGNTQREGRNKKIIYRSNESTCENTGREIGMSSKRSRPTSATAALPSSTRPLRFASWNVLADSLLRQNSWLYQSCDPEALHDRLPRIFNGVERLEPDVLAMQEVEHFARDMEPRLSELGFSGVYKQRTGDDQTDGVALVWRNERLAAEQIEYVEYASALTAGVKDRTLLEMLNKHNVAIVALMRDVASGKLLVVATTHIL